MLLFQQFFVELLCVLVVASENDFSGEAIGLFDQTDGPDSCEQVLCHDSGSSFAV